MPHLSCEYEHLYKCNLDFVVGFEDHHNNTNMSLYCGVNEVPKYIK